MSLVQEPRISEPAVPITSNQRNLCESRLSSWVEHIRPFRSRSPILAIAASTDQNEKTRSAHQERNGTMHAVNAPDHRQIMDAPATTAARILVVGDRDSARTDISKLLVDLGHTVLGQTATGEEAIQLVSTEQPDVVLMDMMLSGDMNSINATRIIQTRFDVPVIFLTAFTDEALINKARVVQPYGMIVKPLKMIDVHAAIQMALYKHARNVDVLRERNMLHQRASTGQVLPFFLKQGARHIRLHLRDIRFVEALRDHVALHVKHERLIAHTTLRNIESRLPPDEFMRVHRSYIVRLDKIASIQMPDILLENDKRLIPIGETYTSGVVARLFPK